jgi:Rieske Fe-S protein
MANDEPRETIDARVDTPGREGLTGTAASSVYTPQRDAEQVTIAPDWRPMEEQPAWRTDFPIDWPQDHYVERRDFVKFMVLTSLAFTAGQLWIGLQNWLRRRRGLPEMRRIAAVDEVPIGGAVTFTYPEVHDDCILVRLDERRFVAYGQKCTHLSCAVRPVRSEGVLQCPCHEGSFDLASGRPVAGPPRRPLDLVRLELRQREIYATGVVERTT